MIELREVNAFHCESENLFRHIFLYPHRPVYQKSVCCYCVHTISVTMTYNDTESPQITTLILTVDHEAILQLITNYSYSNFCYSYFCFVCVDHSVSCLSIVWFEGVFLEIEKRKSSS